MSDLTLEIINIAGIVLGIAGGIVTLIIGIKKIINVPLKAYFNEKFQDYKEYLSETLHQIQSTTNMNREKIDNMENIITNHDVLLKEHFQVVYDAIKKTIEGHDHKIDCIEKKLKEHDDYIKDVRFDIRELKKIVDKNKNGEK